jgi:multiple sugar transport system ATP-binding protein
MMATILMENVSKHFAPSQRYCDVQDVNFEIKDGEFFCLVGPTNSGKTTTLRLIAGLEKPDSGRIFIDGKEVNEVHPNRRKVAMLFETLALYPNKNGYGNIASPLKIKKVKKAEIERSVLEVAKLLGLEHLLDRTPETYSGGEKQRVALGRVLVQRPKAYLLDEPLGGLDARLRISMRSELKRIQRDLGQTMVLASHDQEETMSLGNRIAVLRNGKVSQIDTPQDLYNHPTNLYVAKTIGKPAMNFFQCILKGKNGKMFVIHDHFSLDVTDSLRKTGISPKEDRVVLGIRPEHIEISDVEQNQGNIAATVFITEPIGARTIVDFRIGEETIRTLVPSDKQFEIKETKWLRFREDKLHFFEKTSEEVIL